MAVSSSPDTRWAACSARCGPNGRTPAWPPWPWSPLRIRLPRPPSGRGRQAARADTACATRLRRGPWAVARVAVPVVALPFGLARGYPLGVVVDFARQDAASRRGTMLSLLRDPAVSGELAGLRGLDVELPVLLLAARDDRLVPPAAFERWAMLLPRAQAHLLDAGGHQLLWRGGDVLLVRWLQEVAQRSVSPEVVG